MTLAVSPKNVHKRHRAFVIRHCNDDDDRNTMLQLKWIHFTMQSI